jgi:PIF1-like helicase
LIAQVPVNDKNEFLTSPIKVDNLQAALIKSTKVIIWDEAPMANHVVLGYIDEVCHRIMDNSSVPFSGKIIILLGNF